MNENGLHRLSLNIWFPDSGTIWERFGSMASLEELCCSGWALKFPKPKPFPVISLYLGLMN